MHGVAAARLASDAAAAPVALVRGDGARLPIRSESMDAAFASFTIELFDTPELLGVLGELRRALRPAGRLVVVSLTTTDPPALMERVYLFAHRLMPRLADCRPIPVPELVSEAGFRITDRQRCDILGVPIALVIGIASAS